MLTNPTHTILMKDILTHRFLVAMPKLTGSEFAKSVIYLYEHNDEGALGMIINKPLQISLGNILEASRYGPHSGHHRRAPRSHGWSGSVKNTVSLSTTVIQMRSTMGLRYWFLPQKQCSVILQKARAPINSLSRWAIPAGNHNS